MSCLRISMITCFCLTENYYYEKESLKGAISQDSDFLFTVPEDYVCTFCETAYDYLIFFLS
jgi:hypothetical protein